MVYRTTNGGLFFSEGVPVGNRNLYSMTLSPDYDLDGTILVGDTDGWVYWSQDDGASFQPLPADASSPPFDGSISVAFDPLFSRNHTVYAGSDTGGVYRFTVGTSIQWENIGANLSADALINRLITGQNGTLYAVNSDTDGGVERSLDPASSLHPIFEKVSLGLIEGTKLAGLWQSGHRLWSLDIINVKLMTMVDTLTGPATQISPENGVSGTGSLIDHSIKDIVLDWETLSGATGYQWQCSDDSGFSSIPDGHEGSTTASFVRLPALEPATRYYWRVRASAPVLSPWSEKWSFVTCLDTEPLALKPESPTPGVNGVLVKPIFQWTAMAGAESYELLVSTNVDFESPVITRTGDYALPTNIWQSDVELDYDTTYYWKVRATGSDTMSPWSATGIFTTEAAPLEVAGPVEETSTAAMVTWGERQPALKPSPTATAPTITPPTIPLAFTPTMQPQANNPVPELGQSPDIPGWIIYLIGGLLVIIVLTLLIILAIVLKTRHAA
jgi:hypothetical protein